MMIPAGWLSATEVGLRSMSVGALFSGMSVTVTVKSMSKVIPPWSVARIWMA